MIITFLSGIIAFLHLWLSPVAPVEAAPAVVPAAVMGSPVEQVQPVEPAAAAPAAAPVTAEDGTVIDDPDTYYNPCSPVPLVEGEDYGYLFAAGWAGREDDGAEALYPPGC